MAEYTVAGLIETLQNGYSRDEIVIATWWSKDDVAQVIADEGYGREGMSEQDFIHEVWVAVASDIDVALDYAEEQVNSEVAGFVEKFVTRGEQ